MLNVLNQLKNLLENEFSLFKKLTENCKKQKNALLNVLNQLKDLFKNKFSLQINP